IVLRRCIRRALGAFVEILARDAVELGSRSNIDRGLGAALDGDRCKVLGDADPEPPKAAIVVAEARRNEARMQTIRGDTASSEAPRQRAREKDIGEFRAAVDAPSAIVLQGLEIFEIEYIAPMRFGRDVDDARGCRGKKAVAQQRRQPEIAHVIEREAALKPVFGFLAPAEQRARIVE